jgi:dienelactone hydrolase
VNKLKLILFILMSCSLTARAGGLSRATNTLRPIGTAYARQGYAEYLPAGYGGGPASPLLISLIGRMEFGPGTAESLAKTANIGPGAEIARGDWPTERPFVVLTPQHLVYETCPDADEIDAFIQFAKANYHVDSRRIYLTGLSCGARGIAEYLAKYKNKDVAAVVVLSGDFTPALTAGCALARDVAIFGSHGGEDNIIPIEREIDAFRFFAACPERRDVQYVIYDSAKHGDPFVWLNARTADYDVFEWMLQFKKRATPHG